MNRLRHRLAYWLRLLAWRLDPRPELTADIERLLREKVGKSDATANENEATK